MILYPFNILSYPFPAGDFRYAKGSKAVYRSCGLPAGVPAAGGLWGAGRSTMLFSLRDILLYCQMLLNGPLEKIAKMCQDVPSQSSLCRWLVIQMWWEVPILRWTVPCWTSRAESVHSALIANRLASLKESLQDQKSSWLGKPWCSSVCFSMFFRLSITLKLNQFPNSIIFNPAAAF